MKYVLILWLTYAGTPNTIAVTSAEFNTLTACGAAGNKVLEKAPLTVPAEPNVRWVCVEKGAE
jgi:hypothetical protein